MKKLLKTLFIILLLTLSIYLFYNFIFIKYLNKYKLENSSIKINENTQNSPFEISKVIMYSSGYAENQNTTFQQSSWILNILQYSDIAIYIKHSEDELDTSNSVKKLYIDNINFSNPKLGSASLYYLDSLNFGTANIDKNYKLDNPLEFTVLNDENKNNSIQSNTPVFFTDCSNPITLKYVNESVKEDYSITSNEPVFFDGRLLKMASLSLDDLQANINFTIHIESNDNKNYFYDLSLPVILENDNSSIYDGSILVENEYENYKFMEDIE